LESCFIISNTHYRYKVYSVVALSSYKIYKLVLFRGKRHAILVCLYSIVGFIKSASAPPRGKAWEPGSYYWCSIRIVLIDYQSKRRDVRTAAHHWRCDRWAWKRSFFLLGGWALTRLQKHDQHVLTYNQPARITSTSISVSPLLLHSIYALYYTTSIQYTRSRKAYDEPLYLPTFLKPLIYRL